MQILTQIDDLNLNVDEVRILYWYAIWLHSKTTFQISLSLTDFSQSFISITPEKPKKIFGFYDIFRGYRNGALG